jgi:hypothetical protein
MNEQKFHGDEEILDIEIIDIEEFVKKGHPVPKGKKYRIRIDKTQYVVHVSEMKGREILALAGKIPVEKYRLYQKLKHGESREIGYDQVADFTAPEVERFMTIPLDQQEGSY